MCDLEVDFYVFCLYKEIIFFDFVMGFLLLYIINRVFYFLFFNIFNYIYYNENLILEYKVYVYYLVLL